jgi:hypothetical protein
MVALCGATAITAVWSYVLLARSPDWHPWLRYAVLLAGLAAAAGLLLVGRLPRTARLAVAGTAIVAALAGPLAYSLNTAATPHTGAIVSAGPAVADAFGPGGRAFGGPPGGFNGLNRFGATATAATSPAAGRGSRPVRRAGSASRAVPPRAAAARAGCCSAAGRRRSWSACSSRTRPTTPGRRPPSGRTTRPGTSWPARSRDGDRRIQRQRPVTDPGPVRAVRQHRQDPLLHRRVQDRRRDGGSSNGQQITAWVEQNFTAQTVDGVTVYDLSQGVASITS